MNKKPKLLWIGDIVVKTGFARVTENVLPFIKDDFDITVLGNNWWGDPLLYRRSTNVSFL